MWKGAVVVARMCVGGCGCVWNAVRIVGRSVPFTVQRLCNIHKCENMYTNQFCFAHTGGGKKSIPSLREMHFGPEFL